jgi:hypothetical protein
VTLLRLNGKQQIELRDLLRKAFSRQRFHELLLTMDRDIEDYAGADDGLTAVILNAVEVAVDELWWRELLREACNFARDPALMTFGEAVGFAPEFVTTGGGATTYLKGHNLELRIKESGSTYDIIAWRERVAEIESRVCRIEFPEGAAQATGFLVGPDLVLTNFHVVEKIYLGTVAPKTVALRFDYKVLSDGVAVSKGAVHKLSDEWLVDFSRYGKADLESRPIIEAAPDELDYALLRLSSSPGHDRADGTARGWVTASGGYHDFGKSRALYIVQHPDGLPMKIALDTQGVIESGPARIRYTTTTEPGSSGSPCFNADWQWVALHNSGDPKYVNEGSKPEYNQGIPASAIVSLLERRGKRLPPTGETLGKIAISSGRSALDSVPVESDQGMPAANMPPPLEARAGQPPQAGVSGGVISSVDEEGAYPIAPSHRGYEGVEPLNDEAHMVVLDDLSITGQELLDLLRARFGIKDTSHISLLAAGANGGEQPIPPDASLGSLTLQLPAIVTLNVRNHAGPFPALGPQQKSPP